MNSSVQFLFQVKSVYSRLEEELESIRQKADEATVGFGQGLLGYLELEILKKKTSMPRGCSLPGSREPLGEARRSGGGRSLG